MRTTFKKKELSWKPVADGDYYCAPACGAKCTRKQYEAAVAQAAAIAAALGPGWEPSVSENMGWFAGVRSPSRHIHVSPFNQDGTNQIKVPEQLYSAYLSTEPDCPGGQWFGRGATPSEAVRAVLSRLAALVELYKKVEGDIEREREDAAK